MLASAATALASLAIGLWFVRFVSVAVARDDWIGWLATGLLAMCGLAVVMLLLREIVGFIRIGRIGRVRHDAEAALRSASVKAERACVQGLRASFAGRGELTWHLARLTEHERDVHDAGALLRLAEREVIAPLDVEARRVVAHSVKRVAMVTAISPTAIITIGTLAFETLRMLRRLAAIYGGRPGLVGTLRLARAALGSIIAAGVVDFTTDFVGQFIGQDLMRRLSTRLGEGVFNGALTARIGSAAIDIVRPLPFMEVRPIRARDFLGDLWRMARGGAEAPRSNRSEPHASGE
jgi:putative membrane protein